MSTYLGIDPGGLRQRNLSTDGVEIFFEEEESSDSEIIHVAESVDFFLIEGTGSLSSTPLNVQSLNAQFELANELEIATPDF